MPRPSCLIHPLSVHEPCIGTVALDNLGSQLMLLLPLGASKILSCPSSFAKLTQIPPLARKASLSGFTQASYGIQNSAVRLEKRPLRSFSLTPYCVEYPHSQAR